MDIKFNLSEGLKLALGMVTTILTSDKLIINQLDIL